ncbi:MAG: HEAT repeat domain-containing protein [Bacteroidetes bacterium]|nr:HEAT repeat domain-containing protein [Bacteroidota bacterium]
MKKLQVVLAAVLVTLLLSTNNFAQNQEMKTDVAANSLNTGIKAESSEIRKEALFNLAKEENKETIPVFIDRLKTETDEELRLLIARILYNFNDLEAIEALEDMAWNDENLKLRIVCAGLCQDYASKNPNEFRFNAEALNKKLKYAKSN